MELEKEIELLKEKLSLLEKVKKMQDEISPPPAPPIGGIDSCTKLMLHMNGTDDDAQIDTDNSRFGGASGFFDGSDDYINDLHKQKVIEKYGNKNGSWRKRNAGLQKQDFMNAPRDEFDIKLPLELHKLVKLYPGDCILVSGDKSIGMTSFHLITASLNMHSKESRYLNVESGGIELRNRLERFGITYVKQRGDKSFIAREVSGNFADQIDDTPNVIYLIDYLECLDCSEDEIQARHEINKIHDALRGKQSVAIIGVQTNPRTGFPFGGQGLLHRPGLGISLEWKYNLEEGWERIMVIKDAKTPRYPEDPPKGKYRRYLITDGASQMRAIDEWK